MTDLIVYRNALDAYEDGATEALVRLVPSHLRVGLAEHVVNGRRPGDFLTAVLSNDLSGAVGRADDESILWLRDIVLWLYNYAPGSAWGSPEAVLDWQQVQQLRRLVGTV